MIDFNADKTTLTALLYGASTRSLDIVDAQKDFMEATGALAVNPQYGCKEDASKVIAPLNAFLAGLPQGAFDYALVKFDTHFADEYARSPEAKLFPNPHCVFGTKGWDLAIDIAPLVERIPTYMLAKNEFDMWGSNPTGVARRDIRFTGSEARAYDNLFGVIALQPFENPALRQAHAFGVMPRNLFFDNRLDGRAVVVLCGVASDFCDDQAMRGYLERGATVIALEDLTAGIGGPGSPAPDTGAMRDVVAARIAANPEFAGRLYTAQSADILECLNELAVAPGKPAPRQRAAIGLRR